MIQALWTGLSGLIFFGLMGLMCGARTVFVVAVQLAFVASIYFFAKAFRELNPTLFLPAFGVLVLVWIYAGKSRRIENSHGFGTKLYSASFYPSETKIVYLCFLDLPVLPVRALVTKTASTQADEYYGFGVASHRSKTVLADSAPAPLFPPSVKCVTLCGFGWLVLFLIALAFAKYGP